MEIFTSKRKIDKDKERLIAAYEQAANFRGIDGVLGNALNSNFSSPASKRYFHDKHA